MSRAKQTPKRKHRACAVPLLGAAGLSLALASGASAATEVPVTDTPTQDTGVSHEITLGEEEISDVSLATFYVFDKENPQPSWPRVQLAHGCGGGGGCGCGHGGGGCGGAHAAGVSCAACARAGVSCARAGVSCSRAGSWGGGCKGCRSCHGCRGCHRGCRGCGGCGSWWGGGWWGDDNSCWIWTSRGWVWTCSW